jgi:cell division protein FtsB
MSKVISKIWPILKNKYYLTVIILFVWLAFFDGNNFYGIYKLKKNLHHLEQERNFYIQETAKVNIEKQELFNSQKSLEKFARERYFMKHDDEDIYIFETLKKLEE